MKLPNPERAVIDRAKLVDYCLNPNHPRGKHKARVFESALGITANESDDLESAIRDSALILDATLGEADEYGQRYVIDFMMIGPNGEAMVRSTWIVRAGEDFARLTSCYVL